MARMIETSLVVSSKMFSRALSFFCFLDVFAKDVVSS